MLAFHNNPAVKAKYVGRLKAHRAAENLIQGTGWGGGKGCAVGCTLERYEHAQYPVELGVPEEIARLEDRIFEGLPKGAAEQFAVDFLDAIPIGADLSDVWRLLAIERHTLALTRLEGNAEPYSAQVRDAIVGVLEYLKTPAESARSAAESAARSAAESAAGSAESAARSAWSGAESAARSAAWSAESAAWSAWSAARSAAESAARSAAESAARSAAWSAHFEWESATLIKLLKASK